MQHDHNNAQTLIRSIGLKATKGRIAIVEAFLSAAKPLSQEQIAARLGKEGLNKVTIYRALESFLAAGAIHKAYLQHRRWFFELAHNCTESQCHPHFTCIGCGATHCMTSAAVPLAQDIEKGFVIHRQKVLLEGLCPACSQKQSSR